MSAVAFVGLWIALVLGPVCLLLGVIGAAVLVEAARDYLAERRSSL